MTTVSSPQNRAEASTIIRSFRLQMNAAGQADSVTSNTPARRVRSYRRRPKGPVSWVIAIVRFVQKLRFKGVWTGH